MPQSYHRLAPRAAPHVLSVVIPLFNEQAVVPALRARLSSCAQDWPCDDIELILVNDGSRDGTLDQLLEWSADDPRVRVIGLARNFGHQAALSAGLDSASGDAVVLMDADLQDPPELVPRLIEQFRLGYDDIIARRRSRAGESPLKRMTAWLFYRAMRTFVHPDLPADAGDFRLLSRRLLEALRQMRETHRFLRGMVAWVGFPQATVEFDRAPRFAGKTHYSIPKMLRLAATAAISFSPLPLRLVLVAGMLVGAFGLADGIYAVVRELLGYENVRGWTSIMAVLCLVGGGILVGIGILGEYVGRIYEEVKGRPLYVVSERANFPAAATSRHDSANRDRDAEGAQFVQDGPIDVELSLPGFDPAAPARELHRSLPRH